MSLRQLEYVIAMADEGSFRATATWSPQARALLTALEVEPWPTGQRSSLVLD